ncbi:hypothetical protein ACN6KF_001513 [Labrys sp. La1]|uniref:hypothetical protein n=1 Tax=Labrys sp. La1 TaxID=3404917 RepID=UPI003EBACC2D
MKASPNSVTMLMVDINQAGRNIPQDQLKGKWIGVSGQLAGVTPAHMTNAQPATAMAARTSVLLRIPEAITLNPRAAAPLLRQ